MQKPAAIPREKISRLAFALKARQALLNADHISALRLFNGFYEGIPELVVDLFGCTLVLYNYASNPDDQRVLLQAAQVWYLEQLPWLQAVIIKARQGAAQEEKNGLLTYGKSPDDRILEKGVWYALDLQMNQDASLYLDTRNLRIWLRENMRRRRVLNTFAYTGSLGAAALAGGARQVIQTDRSRKFLQLAQRTYDLNGIKYDPADFLVSDFHRQVGVLKRTKKLFDCVVLDPPYFSVTPSGRVDFADESRRLINKVRPLVAHDGWLVVVNNALYLSGEDFLRELKSMCQDDYMKVEMILNVPADITGYPETRVTAPPVNPAPFNHPTKIVVLRVTRKDEASAV